jgi:adenylate cyclase
MTAEAIAGGIEAGKVSLDYMDLPHYRWAALGTMTYRDLAEKGGLPLDFFLDIVQAMGLTRPAGDDRIREDDEILVPITQMAMGFMDRDALIRVSRVYVDALRRIAEAESTLFDSYIVGGFMRQGMTFKQAVDLANEFGAQVTPHQEAMILMLYRRQQERRWTDYVVEGIEGVLDEMGVYDRPDRPPAFGFVDLAGYTRLTEERGDAEVARLVGDLSQMVNEVATANAGQPVKWLGDGVMVYFKNPGDAVSATLEMVRQAPEVGLPAHAGVAAGPVVFQDGDYYGRTVNMAARIAAHATAGRTLVSEDVARLAADRPLRFVELDPIELKGFARPVPVYEALTG